METLDARQLLCPLPVIRVQDRVKTMQPGETLEVTCTDPGTRHDIPAWCRIHGHRIINCWDENTEIVFRLEVGA
ncbi:MAG: sulfurtransferase TusA family protein [Methylococcales bacterium]|jgi:tRNA 2-thiouridine synthesizing protein A|nr:sulfurtransferase TusA family protein [Methylococcales bacterium]MEE2767023.1 sulfurtransferase TusA family protein [Pseudomonadota bacterium]